MMEKRYNFTAATHFVSHCAVHCTNINELHVCLKFEMVCKQQSVFGDIVTHFLFV